MENGREAFWDWSDHYNGQGEFSKRTHLALATLKKLHYKKEPSMEFEKYSENLTRDFAKLGKDPEQRMLARKNVEVLPNGIKTAETELIACKTIIRYNCASDFTGTCSHFSAQFVRLHGGAQMEAQRYKRRISEVSRSNGGRGGG